MPSLLRPLVAASLLVAVLTACGGSGTGATDPPSSSNSSSSSVSSTSSSSGTGSSSGSSSSGGAAATTDVLTYHNDTMRTGQALTEATLTPANVTSASFGLLHLLPADGLVDAAPLVVSKLTI